MSAKYRLNGPSAKPPETQGPTPLREFIAKVEADKRRQRVERFLAHVASLAMQELNLTDRDLAQAFVMEVGAGKGEEKTPKQALMYRLEKIAEGAGIDCAYPDINTAGKLLKVLWDFLEVCHELH